MALAQHGVVQSWRWCLGVVAVLEVEWKFCGMRVYRPDLLNFFFFWQSRWIPYVLFSLLALVEQSIMVALWMLVKLGFFTPLSPFVGYDGDAPDSANYTLIVTPNSGSSGQWVSVTSLPSDETYLGFLPSYEYFLLFIHYCLFVISMIFMSFTFCCARCYSDTDEEWDDEDDHIFDYSGDRKHYT